MLYKMLGKIFGWNKSGEMPLNTDVISETEETEEGAWAEPIESEDEHDEHIEIIALGGQSEIGCMNCIAFVDVRNNDAVICDFGIDVKTIDSESEEASDANGVDDDGDNGDDNRNHKSGTILATRKGKRCPDLSPIAGKDINLVCITHVHNDHVGGLPILYNKYPNIAVMTHPSNIGIIQEIFRKEGMKNLPPFIGEKVTRAGRFRIKRFPVNHSVKGSCGFMLELLEAGEDGEEDVRWRHVHTGDYKLWTPHFDKKSGIIKDKNAEVFGGLARHGRINSLSIDSTNADKKDERNISEKRVRREIKAVLRKEPGRALISFLASNALRAEGIIQTGHELARPVYVVGPQMHEFLHNERVSGWEDLLVRSKNNNCYEIYPPPDGGLEKAEDENEEDIIHPRMPDNAIILCSGCLGEPRSFLDRLAKGEINFPYRQGDILINAQSTIPLREIQDRVENMLMSLGGRFNKHRQFDRIYLSSASPYIQERWYGDGAKFVRNPFIHSSGHGTREKIVKLQQLLEPEYTIPIHGGEGIRRVVAGLVTEVGGKPITINDGEKASFKLITPSVQPEGFYCAKNLTKFLF